MGLDDPTDDGGARADPRVDRTRAKVLAAGAELLREVGFAAVTIEQISSRSGVSRSTMYRHWETREEILRDAFTAVALPPPAPADGSPASLREDVRLYARAFADGLEHTWGRAAATMVSTSFDDPAQHRMVSVFTDGYAQDVARLLTRASERGETLRAHDPVEVADRLVAPLFHRFLFRHLPLDDAFVAAQADFVTSDLLR